MKTAKVLLVSILALLVIGFHAAPLQAQSATQGSGMDMKTMQDMKDMKPHMEQMRVQMEQMQLLMKDNMAKMAAADAAMKSHMEAEQAKMKSDMELQQAMMNQLQSMTDHMQAMADHMAMMPGAKDMHKKDGATVKKDKDKPMVHDQKQ